MAYREHGGKSPLDWGQASHREFQTSFPADFPGNDRTRLSDRNKSPDGGDPAPCPACPNTVELSGGSSRFLENNANRLSGVCDCFARPAISTS